MPEEHFNVMDYYKNGTQDQRKKHKLWSALLDDMYDDNLNRIGMAKMYKVLQAANPEPGAYPTKRFIKDYLNRQHDNQVRKQPHSNNQDVIRSVITQRPNQIIMVDYLYFYWEANDLRGKGPIDDDDINDKTKQSKDNTTEVDKLFAEEKEKYRGVLVAIDVFSKYGYVEKIEGNINSEKAWKAMDNILKDANNKFGKEFGPVRIIQTCITAHRTALYQPWVRRPVRRRRSACLAPGPLAAVALHGCEALRACDRGGDQLAAVCTVRGCVGVCVGRGAANDMEPRAPLLCSPRPFPSSASQPPRSCCPLYPLCLCPSPWPSLLPARCKCAAPLTADRKGCCENLEPGGRPVDVLGLVDLTCRCGGHSARAGGSGP